MRSQTARSPIAATPGCTCPTVRHRLLAAISEQELDGSCPVHDPDARLAAAEADEAELRVEARREALTAIQAERGADEPPSLRQVLFDALTADEDDDDSPAPHRRANPFAGMALNASPAEVARRMGSTTGVADSRSFE